ncbi:hypothetical protein GWR56_15100 [Mucilaginibacter sp. 14171R-50]|uniref:hypothetical protein n=1 Tax=Mucilaginibacter sp. 14171R-50 TaxID=2703789 RepID=UPI00138D8CAB|nr:hypothetical protein [Mucilaginibacter sp. 14171R-50]QHS56807.1 hypothetical protein GWR56_15100 [Mucilaginibacter sp. 14171R-50]
MPCLHKFNTELYLEHLDYDPETLILGTFNPAWPEENSAKWFYGRTRNSKGKQSNNFWEVLPRLYGQQSLIDESPEQWKLFCRTHGIAISDLIYCIKDANPDDSTHKRWLKTYSDHAIATRFEKHVKVNLKVILASRPSIKYIYLTRGAKETDHKFWQNCWKPVLESAELQNKRARTLLTPSRYAFYQQAAYNKDHPDQRIPSLPDFILKRWQSKWHF